MEDNSTIWMPVASVAHGLHPAGQEVRATTAPLRDLSAAGKEADDGGIGSTVRRARNFMGCSEPGSTTGATLFGAEINPVAPSEKPPRIDAAYHPVHIVPVSPPEMNQTPGNELNAWKVEVRELNAWKVEVRAASRSVRQRRGQGKAVWGRIAKCIGASVASGSGLGKHALAKSRGAVRAPAKQLTI